MVLSPSVLSDIDSDLPKGISGQQTQTGREGSFYKTDSEEGGQGILIPFHELRKITEPGNQLKAGFAAG